MGIRARRNGRRLESLTSRLVNAVTPSQRATAVFNHLASNLPAEYAADQQVHKLVDAMLDAADEVRAMRARAAVASKFSKAHTGREHLFVALDYLRAAIGKDTTSPAVAARIERLLTDAIQTTDRQKGGRR